MADGPADGEALPMAKRGPGRPGKRENVGAAARAQATCMRPRVFTRSVAPPRQTNARAASQGEKGQTNAASDASAPAKRGPGRPNKREAAAVRAQSAAGQPRGGGLACAPPTLPCASLVHAKVGRPATAGSGRGQARARKAQDSARASQPARFRPGQRRGPARTLLYSMAHDIRAVHARTHMLAACTGAGSQRGGRGHLPGQSPGMDAGHTGRACVHPHAQGVGGPVSVHFQHRGRRNQAW
eukprot:352731-Chlamydomonas_euryale.AAC.4